MRLAGNIKCALSDNPHSSQTHSALWWPQNHNPVFASHSRHQKLLRGLLIPFPTSREGSLGGWTVGSPRSLPVESPQPGGSPGEQLHPHLIPATSCRDLSDPTVIRSWFSLSIAISGCCTQKLIYISLLNIYQIRLFWGSLIFPD